MEPELDRRTYDLLRLVDRHGPIGSIQLVELMELHGYDIKDRTIRLMLSDLDELGFTEKVPGKGRRLTDSGRVELQQGDVGGRLEQIRARIATLVNRVSYDPAEDAGSLVASAAFLDADAVGDAAGLVERLESLPLGPLPVRLEESSDTEPGDYRLLAPSSITLDGVLLSQGVNANLATAGVLEYEPAVDADADALVGEADRGGRVHRYVDVINGEGSSIDVISLLIEANRSDVRGLFDDGGSGLLIGDDREFPLNRYERTRELAVGCRRSLGGVLDFRRPGEHVQFPSGDSVWAFGALTYVGPGELLLAALHEFGLAAEWETLYGTVARRRLEPVRASPAAALDD